ncbi:hypothetical protein GLYMA_16G081600v4 [Glycine max]|uniref:Inhibitor I9 domain-containing protein n=2 Tax=Glycine subgen. Soja TaxID=1462606 RepID=K7MFV9_SOYBN|nr:hypothetical protein GYH30_044484 [Glycine max]KRH07326.1 hypothetical protein GLYMA_16G081600v4 [Glycine max]RZB60113.1 hypothetical protein D0Y65_043044 [Glycine soja]
MRFAKILSSFTLLFIGYTLVNGSTPKHYIVYMGDHSHPNSESVIRANHEILASVTGSISEPKAAALHHYSKSFQGFSAMITPEQAS